MDYISVRDAAIKWAISERRIQKLCEENRIDGVVRFGRSWAIPKDAPKPLDTRLKQNRKGSDKFHVSDYDN
ncbi:DNA-binding protein [Candidatus Galacturonibacter soehngenii]|uniref:DNA-binding protein n=1 Tax=Candidatus Galacturonatibacter soehngenii TaxID=2307010 RepID=A0A7V7QHS3_9FIRM|nr:DNA-binding protein [Candidatus Galacturonibacter soehngenii]KAB1434549.1 DNA-binding protein [Candidatus Galacturonibacter soehngenii]